MFMNIINKIIKNSSKEVFHLFVGIEEEIYCPVSYVRIINHLQFAPVDWKTSVFVLPRDIDAAKKSLSSASILLLARCSSEQALQLARQAKAVGIKIVYDLDDYLWKLPDYIVEKDLGKGVDAVISESDLVTTSTKSLKDFVTQRFIGKQVHIIPNAGNIQSAGKDYFTQPAVTAVCANSDFFRLPGMKTDFFCALRDASRDAGVQLFLYYLSNDPPENFTDDPHFQVIWAGIRSYSSYRNLLNRIAPKIAFVPLPDDHFSRFKSVIKFAEFGAHSIAGIFSNVEPYASFVRPHIDGWLVENTKEGWYNIVKEVLSISSNELSIVQKNAQQRSQFEFDESNIRQLFFKTLLSLAPIQKKENLRISNDVPALAPFTFLESYDYINSIYRHFLSSHRKPDNE